MRLVRGAHGRVRRARDTGVWPRAVYIVTMGSFCTGPYRYTNHLQQLDACRPKTARSHERVPQLGSINSPLSARLLEWQSRLQCHPDQSFANYILQGIEQGFRVGFDYSHLLCSAKRNMPSALEHPEVVERYLGEECSARRILGPFRKGDIPDLHINRFGVIPKGKGTGKWRLITDLSFPEGASVNDGISSELCTLQYTSVDKIARVAYQMGLGALLAKADIKAAYRLVPVHPDDRPLMGVEWHGALYVDAMLPFGLRSAPKVFTAVADALEWCIRRRGVTNIDHYLDDFVIVAPPASNCCRSYLSLMHEECAALGVTLAAEKTVGPTTCLTFLGIEIDTVARRLRLPAEKLRQLRQDINEWWGRKSCKKRELESLVGTLQYAAKVIRPGRSFVRQMIDLLKGPRRPFHHVRLNQQFQADLLWWKTFAEDWNGVALFPPQLEPSREFASDASGSWGCGAWWRAQWWQSGHRSAHGVLLSKSCLL